MGKLLLGFTLLASSTAWAQLDLSGVWAPSFHEDNPERGLGPELVDFAGLPISDAARQWALSWDPDRLGLPEHQCQVHTAAYIHRGPLRMRLWEERDPQTQDVVAIREYISTYEQNRTIWMDGRAHPPDYAAHTWMGFSTGKWEGNILTVYTTHIKQGWHRRNGLPSSDLIDADGTLHSSRQSAYARQHRRRSHLSDRAFDQDSGLPIERKLGWELAVALRVRG